MQRETYILGRLSKGNSPLVRALCFTLISTFSLQASATNMGRLKGMKGFQATALAVAMINKAMKDAAENPMDKWRRQNVASTMGLLPIAITALAQDFKSGKLHDADLAFVQGILGGFVDVNAAGSFDKFAKDPSKGNIPQLGANFPREYLDRAEKEASKPGTGGGTSYGFDESNSKNDSVAMAPNSQVTNLSGISAKDISDKTVSSGTGTSGKTTASINSNDNARPSGLVEGRAPGAKSPGAASPTGSLDSALEREISSVEAQMGLVTPKGKAVTVNSAAVQKDSLSDDFFKEPKEQKVKKGAHREASPQSYKLSVKPKFWSVVPVLRLLSAQLETGALATAAAPDPNSNGKDGNKCDKCDGSGQGGGGQGGGGQGGGGGGGAGETLMGIAAMIAAASPMVAAAMQADADKKIAKINADTQIQMTQITAENSKYLADSQSRMAQQQTATAQQINQTNNDEQTKRLNMQLAEVRASRDQATKAEQDKRAMEKQYNDQRIALAEKQADDNLKLARKTFDAQLTQAGMSSGFSGVNGQGGLNVQRVTNNSFATGSSAANRFGGALASNTAAGGGLTGPNLSAGGGTAAKAAASQTQRAFAGNRLLASVQGNNLEDDGAEIDQKTGRILPKKKTPTTLRGIKVSTLAANGTSAKPMRGIAVENSGVSLTSLGSSRTSRQRIAMVNDQTTSHKTDLANFQRATESGPSFAQSRAIASQTQVVGSVNPSLGSSNHSGAYNSQGLSSGARGAVSGIYGIVE